MNDLKRVRWIVWPFRIQSLRNCAFNHKNHQFKVQDGNDRVDAVTEMISFNYLRLIFGHYELRM